MWPNQKYNAAKIISNFFYHKKLELLEKNIEKEPQRPHSELKKYVFYIFTENICSTCNPMEVVVFWENVLIL